MDKTAPLKRRNSYFLQTILLLMTYSLMTTTPSPVAVTVNTGHHGGVRTMDTLLPPAFKPEKADIHSLHYVKQWNSTKNILLVGAQDNVFMVGASPNVREVHQMERLHWHPDDENNVKFCLKAHRKCSNVFVHVNVDEQDQLKVCGSNAYLPTCRYYSRTQFNAPTHTSNSPYTGKIGLQRKPYDISRSWVHLVGSEHSYQAVYSGTSQSVPTFMMANPNSRKTESAWFKNPVFVKILEYGDKIFIFFREHSSYKENHSNQEKMMYSRVAQVCKNESVKKYAVWDTFLKARLQCNLKSKDDKGEELTFNNLTAVSNVVSVQLKPGENPVDVVFLAATTPSSWGRPYGTAICMLKMQEQVADFFDEAGFLEAEKMDELPEYQVLKHGWNSKYYNTKPVKGPVDRPGRCSTDHNQNDVMKFMLADSTHRTMYGSIETEKVLHVTGPEHAVTQIVATSANGGVDIYLGTDSATVLHLRSFVDGDDSDASVAEIPLKDSADAVRDMKLIPSPSEPETLAVALSDQVSFITVKKCILIEWKENCESNPSCLWSGDSRCSARGSELTSTRPGSTNPASTTSYTFVQDATPTPEAAIVDKGKVKDKIVDERVAFDNSTFYALTFCGGLFLGWLTYFTFAKLKKHRRKSLSKSTT